MSDLPTRTRMSAEEFLQLPETNLPCELIDGEVIMAPAPTLRHQTVSIRLASLVERLAEEKGGHAWASPTDVYLDETTIVQPDVLYLAPDTQCEMTEQHVVGGPDLVIEIASPSTVWRDKSQKFDLYEGHGVREYWLVDPLGDVIEVWGRVDEAFQRQGVYTTGQTFTSAVLRVEIDVTPLLKR